MERAVCEHCGHQQPRDWAAGDLCVACGAAVRREVQCAWCAEWIPAGRFCRTCGCEVLGPEQYGAARMLKQAGVDRYSLAQRLRELDPEQIANLGRIYNAQLAVVARRVEEVRLCESGLLQKQFSRRLEEELVPRLPIEKEDLAALAAGPAGPFQARPELLPEIARESPLQSTRMLAAIALLRGGCFAGTFAAAEKALYSGDAELALEAALAFAHWRVRLDPERRLPRQRLAEVAGAVPRDSPLRSWAAAAVTLALSDSDVEASDWLQTALREGLSPRDPDLRFTCAMALGDCETVSAALDSEDAQQRLVARRFLAKHKSPAIGPFLLAGPDEVRWQILEDLWEPLPPALVEPVLRAVEQGGPEIRRTGTWLLRSSLTEDIVERLLRLGEAEVVRILLSCERLPASRSVVRAILRAGWLEKLWGPLYDAPQHVDFADEALSQVSDAGVLEKLVTIADRQLDRRVPAGDVERFLMRAAFGAGPEEVRTAAYRTLDRREPRWWRWFASPGDFGNALISALQDAAPRDLCHAILDKLASGWEEPAEILAADPEVLADFAAALAGLARERFQEEAAELVAKTAVLLPGVALPALAALLREHGLAWHYRNVPRDLLAVYDSIAGRLAPELAAELAEALIAALPLTALDYQNTPAIELLTRLARDHAGLRERIAAGMAPALHDRAIGDVSLREPLEELASVSGFREEPPAAPEVVENEPPETLDDLEVLPGTVLPTLARYVAAMKAISAASDPVAAMATHSLTLESYVECVTRWGELLGARDDLAMRYARLMG